MSRGSHCKGECGGMRLRTEGMGGWNIVPGSIAMARLFALYNDRTVEVVSIGKLSSTERSIRPVLGYEAFTSAL